MSLLDWRRGTLSALSATFAAICIGGAGGCGREPVEPAVAPDAAGAAGSLEPDAARAQELAAVARDTTRSASERREAALERARWLGKQAPERLTETPPEPPRLEIAAPAGAPASGAVESGRYVLSFDLEYEGGARSAMRVASQLRVEGDRVAIEPDDPQVGRIDGTLRQGRITARAVEGGAEFELDGQVTGPGRLAGSMRGGDDKSGAKLRAGRWSLERLSAADAAAKD